MADFFISRTGSDSRWAQWIAFVLEEAGYSAIVQDWDFQPGANFVLEMDRGIRDCERIVLVLSPAYLDAVYTKPEWAAGLAKDPHGVKRTLLPIRVEECVPEGLLGQTVYLDLVGLGEDEARKRLLLATRPRAKPDERPVFPGHAEAIAQWTVVASLPSPRMSLGAATTDDGHIHAIGGGLNEGGEFSAHDVYIPGADRWITAAPLNVARAALATVSGLDGRIYALGGFTGNFQPLDMAEVYDPATDSWVHLPPMPTARGRLAAACGRDGLIYAIGGSDGGTSGFATVEAYDPDVNEWLSCAPLGKPRYGLAACATDDGHVYAISGYDDGFTPDVERFDPATGRWQAAPPIPTERYFASATFRQGKVYVIGGASTTFFDIVEAYDPGVQSWSSLASMLTPRGYLASALGSDDQIYAIGGVNFLDGTLAAVEAGSFS